MSNGAMLTLGSVAALAAVSLMRQSGSASTQTTVFDGVSLEIDEALAEAAEHAWATYAEAYLPDAATEVPTRAHYRSLANRLIRDARRTQAKNAHDTRRFAAMERAARALGLVADAADQFRRGRLPSAPRTLNPGDRVRVRGRVPFAGLETDRVYEVHETPTREGVPMIEFRIVDALGRPSRHSLGPFRASGVHAMLKPMDDPSLGGALILERVAPLKLEG